LVAGRALAGCAARAGGRAAELEQRLDEAHRQVTEASRSVWQAVVTILEGLGYWRPARFWRKRRGVEPMVTMDVETVKRSYLPSLAVTCIVQG